MHSNKLDKIVSNSYLSNGQYGVYLFIHLHDQGSPVPPVESIRRNCGSDNIIDLLLTRKSVHFVRLLSSHLILFTGLFPHTFSNVAFLLHLLDETGAASIISKSLQDTCRRVEGMGVKKLSNNKWTIVYAGF
jgi:hypothetical protein